MAIAPNPFVAQAELRYSQDAQEVENILHFLASTVWTAEDCARLAQELGVWWNAEVRTLQTSDVALREIYVKGMLNGSAPEGTDSTYSGIQGAVAAPSLPNNVTCSISFRTGRTGRSYRGRNYIIGLAEEAVLRNKVAGSILEAWTNAYIALKPESIYIAAGVWSVYSQRAAGALRSVGLATPIATALFVNDIVDSQRRRLPGRGQ
jgi:hypothetical protein